MSRRIFLYKGSGELRRQSADSGMLVSRNLVKYGSQIRPTWGWHHFFPEYRNEWDELKPKRGLFNRQDRIFIKTHPMPGSWYRWHFDANEFKEKFPFTKYDFDLIFTKDVEIVPFLDEVFNVRSHYRIPIVCYWDWVEIPESNGDIKKFVFQVCGAMLCKKVGVNSIWEKNIILDYAKKFFNEGFCQVLEEKIQPLYLGIEQDEIDSYQMKKEDWDSKDQKFRILWNHRVSDQTGFRIFIEQMRRRKDKDQFEVVVTNPVSKTINADESWIKIYDDLERPDYISLVKSCDLCVGYCQKYSAWSIAITDAIGCGVPVLVPRGFSFEEMLGDDYPLFFSSSDEFHSKLTALLNHCGFVIDMKTIAERLDWGKKIVDWISWIEKSFSTDKIETDTSYKLLDVVKESGVISKHHLLEKMDWGVGIQWTPYRNFLMEQGVQDDTSEEESYLYWREK